MRTFEIICEDNYSRIYRYILGMTAKKELAQDLTQEVFLIAYQKGRQFTCHENPEGFLYLTAKNLVLSAFRKSKREVLQEEGMELTGTDGDLFDELCKEYDSRIAIEQYRETVLKHLKSKDRKLYTEYYVEHLPMHEIARRNKMSENALRMKYVRLRRQIKEEVKILALGEF